MKITLVIIGSFLILLGLFQGGRYIPDYSILTSYGKGYVWGSVIIFLIGVALIFVAFKVSKKSKKNN